MYFTLKVPMKITWKYYKKKLLCNNKTDTTIYQAKHLIIRKKCDFIFFPVQK